MEITCTTCMIMTQGLGTFHKELVNHPDIKNTNNVAFLWKLKMLELAQSAEDGCRFCQFVVDRWFSGLSTFMFGPNITSSTHYQCCFQDSSHGLKDSVRKSIEHIRAVCGGVEDDTVTMRLEVSHSKGRSLPDLDKIKILIHSSPMNQNIIRSLIGLKQQVVIEVFALPHDAAAKCISSRPIHNQPASEGSISQIKKWIDECSVNHKRCPKVEPKALPSRVVEILDEDTLRLHTEGGKAHYTALSYCWGGPQDFATTSETLQERRRGFRISDVPRTLQDAVSITRELGIRYLWVDSLCILQDRAMDRQMEINHMAEIYKRSYVTIGAATGEKCTDGFLEVRNECETHPGTGIGKDLIKHPYTCEDGTVSSVYFREESPYHSMWESISKRAWTLQERMLSPRMLTFGSRLIWTCNTAQHSHGGLEEWDFDTIAAGDNRFYSALPEPSTPETPAVVDRFSRQQIFDLWYKTVGEYCRRALSFEQDKLPAIAAMAIEVQRLTGDRYLAGLWESNLPFELMWTSNPSINPLKPESYRAPSWSWASISNRVAFNMIASDSTLLARIIDCHVIPLSSDAPMGEVTSGEVTLKVPCIKSEPDFVDKIMGSEALEPGPIHNDAARWNKEMLNSLIMAGSRNTNEKEWNAPEDVWCALMFSQNKADPTTADRKTLYSGIVLKKSGSGREGTVYERIGTFFDKEGDPFEKAVTMTITIV